MSYCLRFFKYALVGLAGTACHYMILIGGVTLGILGPVSGSVLGAVLGAVVNYFLNARYTFQSKADGTSMAKFCFAAFIGVLLNAALMNIFVKHVQLYYVFAQIISTAMVLVLTYVINLMWSFRRPSSQRNSNIDE